MNPYINIHTHHLSHDNGVFLFNNSLGSKVPVYVNSYFSVGIHPWDSEIATQDLFLKLEESINHPNCLSIGECGLDKVKGPDLELQKSIFKQQLELAVMYKKPVIIHCVKAFDELIALCSPYHGKIKFIIHGFNKSMELAQQLVQKGFYLSLNPQVMMQKADDIKVVPIEHLFFETDMDKQVTIEEIYRAAALRLNLDLEDLKKTIYTNFTTLFL